MITKWIGAAVLSALMLASTALPAFASGTVYVPPTGNPTGGESTTPSTLPAITNVLGIKSIVGSTPNVTITAGGLALKIQGASGALPVGTQVVVGLNSVSNLGSALPARDRPIADLVIDFQNGSGSSATAVKPAGPIKVVLNIHSSSQTGGVSSLPLDSVVYQESNNGGLTPVPAYVLSKSATITLTSSANLVIVNPNIAPTQRQVLVNGAPQVVSAGFVAHKTTYMPIYSMFKVLKNDLGLDSSWNGTTWNMKTTNPTLQAAAKFMQHMKGKVPSGNNIYNVVINGVTVAVIPGVASAYQTHGSKTTYMQLYWIMQVLKGLGVGSTWNGATWDVTPFTAQ